MHAAGFPRPAPPSTLREKISRPPQYWRPSNCLMQLSIQTYRSHEAKPGDGGMDDRCQAPLIWNSTDELQGRSVMEEWGFVEDRELDSFRGHRSCTTCGHFEFAFFSQYQLLGCWPPQTGFVCP